MERVPFGAHEVPDALVHVFDHGDLRGEGAVAGCPGGEGEVRECHCLGEGGDVGGELGWDAGAVVAGPGFETAGGGRLGLFELLEAGGFGEGVGGEGGVGFAEVVFEEDVVTAEDFVGSLAWTDDWFLGIVVFFFFFLDGA